jgi:ABC-type sulfate/molybdate transport systems ATPase subunit
VRENIDMLHLEGLENAYPGQLSAVSSSGGPARIQV